jgi:hypothetical protein
VADEFQPNLVNLDLIDLSILFLWGSEAISNEVFAVNEAKVETVYLHI